MKKYLIFIAIIMTSVNLAGQESKFDVAVSNDTVLAGNMFIVRYYIKNLDGEFKAPDFGDFEVVSGPSVSSVFTVVNGVSNRKQSYTYYLKADKEGEYTILPGVLYTGGESLLTKELHITVMPNPEGKTVPPGNLPEEKDLKTDFSPWQKKNKVLKNKKKKLKTVRL